MESGVVAALCPLGFRETEEEDTFERSKLYEIKQFVHR